MYFKSCFKFGSDGAFTLDEEAVAENHPMKTNWEGLVEAGDFYTTSIHFDPLRTTSYLTVLQESYSSLTGFRA